MLRTCCYILTLFSLLSCNSQPITFKKKLIEPGFSIKLFDCAESYDGGALFCGRFDKADYDIHNELYGYDEEKYPEYIRKSFSGRPNIILHQTNARGDSLWTKILPFAFEASKIIRGKGQTYYIMGFFTEEREKTHSWDRTQAPVIVKLSKDGTPIWKKQIKSPLNSTAVDLVEVAGGDLIMACHQTRYVGGDLNATKHHEIRLVKLSSDGKLLWDKVWKGKAPRLMENTDQSAAALGWDDSKGLFLLGNYASSTSTFVALLDTSAKTLNQQHFSWKKSNYGTEWNTGFSLAVADDGILISVSAYHGEKAHHLVKLNWQLEKKWEHLQACRPTENSEVAIDKEGNCYFAGLSRERQLILVSFDEDGNKRWEKDFGPPEPNWETEDLEEFMQAGRGRKTIGEMGGIVVKTTGEILFCAPQHTSGISDWNGVMYQLNQQGELQK
ncbi:MAG: hypothetical protein EP338_09060 [Bacteroidetes bacterium]|nr:MAG: hypothetical protein EP338_09060 [Bacteroidota bacterium]